MPLVCATALPALSAESDERLLARLCARWERRAAGRLSPAQREHCRRFGPEGPALSARASRLLARLAALRALPRGACLEKDAAGRPRVVDAPGWEVAFSHSGRAAFCLVRSPEETGGGSNGQAAAALDAEAASVLPSTDRAFPDGAASASASLRRWVIAEALFKALGARRGTWGHIAAAAHAATVGGAPGLAGSFQQEGALLSWRTLAVPGHWLCVAVPGAVAPPVRLRWFPWQALA